jgi:hypothetical protein
MAAAGWLALGPGDDPWPVKIKRFWGANVKIDLGRLTVERLIVHEVPARPARGDGPKPVLSEIDSPLTAELRNYFRERIVGSLTTAAYDVVFDATSGSPVPGLVTEYLGDGRSFVAKSVAIAQHLYQTQTGVNPPGLLVVARVSVQGRRALAILKLEKEEGVRVKQARVEDKRTFSIEHLRDLMLTAKTRVFKVGLFIKSDGPDNGIEGAVSDKQRGYLPKTEVADFFLKRFLGCNLLEAPDVSTKRFFNATEEFIDQEVGDPVRKARYNIALLAELNETATVLRPRDFAQRHLEVDDRQPYITFLEGKGVPTTEISKDKTLIAGQVQRLQIDFSSGLAVLGSPESFREHVQMSQLDDGRTRVQIEDRVNRVHGKR